MNHQLKSCDLPKGLKLLVKCDTAQIRYDKEWSEYRVLLFKGGVHQCRADYHCDTREEAEEQYVSWGGPVLG